MNDDADKKVTAFVARMAARLKDSPPTSLSRQHRAAFLAVRDLVEGALASGYTMKTTWEALRAEGNISMTYETFRAHCRQRGLGRGRRTQTRDRAPASKSAVFQSPHAPLRSAPATQTSGGVRAFQHERVPQKKDIYG